MRILLVVFAALLAHAAAASDQVPFPELKTEAACKALVSKMLDKTEQQIELNKCLVQEAALKLQVKKFWRFGMPMSQLDVVQNYLKEEQYQTYATVADAITQGVGIACMDGRLDCRYPANVILQTENIPQLNSWFYCLVAVLRDHDKAGSLGKIVECMNREQRLKTLLLPFWRGVFPRSVEHCKGFVSDVKRHTYGMLSMCAASDVGTACISGAIECDPRT